MSYYDDLSGASSDEACSSDDDDEFDVSHQHNHSGACSTTDAINLDVIWKRSIIHLDIDCFYCQCEEIDRNLRQCRPLRPLAIGQKHIIVTCNYEARRRGVKKLQLRDNAYAACPDLWIVEGSDLQRYRLHSRKVYEAFRGALVKLSAELFDNNNNNNNNNNSNNSPTTVIIPARKGTMDEMMADLTSAVSQMMETNNPNLGNEHQDTDQQIFLYGETAQSSRTVLVEDQTGQEVVVSYYGQEGNASSDGALSGTRRNVHESFGSEHDRQACATRLLAAHQLAKRICYHIRKETGFHTTAGISVSPLLAKIASDLNKPKSTNVLYPWRSSRLIYSMPLRKMNSIGYGTVKALKGTMSQTDDGSDTRTVRYVE
jgi:DNA polymerase iota